MKIADLVRRMELHFEGIYLNPDWDTFERIVSNTDLDRAVQFGVSPLDIVLNGGWK